MEHPARPRRTADTLLNTRHWTIAGRVQGVGFRPFVYRLAHELDLTGWVRNRSGQVEILTQGDVQGLEVFGRRLLDDAPPTARPRLVDSREEAGGTDASFRILPSDEAGEKQIHVPPDLFTCADCLQELGDPEERRHGYPFINCTQCGPRYTLIERLPYDRPNTSMAGFPLCAACRTEFEDPLDRRFHAQPLACADCGPALEFRGEDGPVIGNADALAACLQALQRGQIAAVKGVGGYHLLCDARSDAAVVALRERKHRPHKPLAVMFPPEGADGLDAVRRDLNPGPRETGLLRDPMRPIVLIRRGPASSLSRHIAPGLDEVGAMLPYSPLHYLLLTGFAGPLVATSGNISGEPVLTDNREAQARLAPVADAFLDHNRPIVRPADDSVFRAIAGAPRPLRLGRGAAPLEIDLPWRLTRPVLALGGHMKNTVALAWGERAVMSPHIGDLDSPRSLDVFQQVIADLQNLYEIQAQAVACDAHPAYASSRWARGTGLPLTIVPHHQAHASALALEHDMAGPWLMFTWDGVGYGPDDTLWGGETLFGRPGAWRRIGSMRPFRLPGGERAGREPWRSAAALCWEAGLEYGPESVGEQQLTLLRGAWEKGINSPETSAVGRLFDAFASLAGLVQEASHEGQGPMWLEALAGDRGEVVELPLEADAQGIWRADWEPLLRRLVDSRPSPTEAAGMVHRSFAGNILRQAQRARDIHGEFRVGLTGGVFQNRVLTEATLALLEQDGFDVCLATRAPCNDGGLCLGQVAEFGAREALD